VNERQEVRRKRKGIRFESVRTSMLIIRKIVRGRERRKRQGDEGEAWQQIAKRVFCLGVWC
jgi:hypothetical protein